MINVLLTGVGGQGTVLAAKILATAAASHDWQVRTAETIGMSQRGGSVVSHVRIGDAGEEVHAPLITLGTADLIIAFEPAEGARVLPYLAKGGMLVSAMTPVRPPSEALAGESYTAPEIIEGIKTSFYNAMAKRIIHEKNRPERQPKLLTVEDSAVINLLGGNRRVLNTILLTAAISQKVIPITIHDLYQAIPLCIKPDYVSLNLKALEMTLEGTRYDADEG